MIRYSTLLLAVACGCAGGTGMGAVPGVGGGTYSSPREDRVLVTAFDDVRALAAGRRHIFAAGPQAMIAYDRLSRRWLPPIRLPSSLAGESAYLMAADPVEDAVWVATRDRLYYLRPGFDVLASALLPAPVRAIVFDRQDLGRGAWLHDGSRWWSASRVGTVALAAPGTEPAAAARIITADARAIFDRHPALRSFAPLLTRDAQMRSWPITAAAEAPDAGEVWLGTRGGGLFRADPAFARGERIPYGLLEEGAGALAAVDGTIWIGGVGRSPFGRSGLTAVDPELQRWRWIEPSSPSALTASRTHAMVARDGAMWVGTSRGLARVEIESARATSWTVADGLPADGVHALAVARDGLWAGTAGGLVFVGDEAPRARGVSETLLPGVGVHALAMAGGSLWIASDAGLLVLPSAHPDSSFRSPLGGGGARGGVPVRALAAHDTLVFAIAGGELLRLNVRTGERLPPLPSLDAATLRGTTRMAADRATVWLAGDRGVLVLDHHGGVLRRLTVPADVPDHAWAVLLDDSFAWIATRAGVMRIRRAQGGAPR